MKLKLLIYTALAIFIFIAFWGFFTLRNRNKEKPVDKSRAVYIIKTESGYQLYRNGEPFFIRGAAGNSHFDELSQVNGNTIRLYDTLNLSSDLDEAYKYGLAVIVDIPLPQYNKKYYYYSDKEYNQLVKQQVKELVKKHKNHPALLFWNLGNELMYPFVLRKNDFIKTFNELIEIIHTEDPNHPVSTAIAGVGRKATAGILTHSPQLDLVAFNSFGNLTSVKAHLREISFLFGTVPYYLSEFGSDGPWETRYTSWGAPIEPTTSKKTEHLRERYSHIMENQDDSFLGLLVFYWGFKLERTYTWYSLFVDGYKSESINEIENLWNGSQLNSNSIGLDYMLVEGKGAYDNLIFSPSEFKTAEIFFKDKNCNQYNIRWEILPEVWIHDTSKMILNPMKPLDIFVDFYENTANFLTPEHEGAYRIFAHVFDQNGFFATTNTPFYVLNKNGKK